MSRLRTVLSSLILSTTLLAGCAATAQRVVTPDAHHQTQLDRSALRAKLAERRRLVIDRFLAYREARTYPVNNLPGGGFRHVWLDDQGHLCAAATLISDDWGREAAIRAMQGNREIKLADIKQGPLADWILTSGLTHHEIVAIQVPGFEQPITVEPVNPETERLYGIYVDVERQLRGLDEESLDTAVDALMARPDLARELLSNKLATR